MGHIFTKREPKQASLSFAHRAASRSIFLRDLHALCKSMDPSRLTTMAQVSTVPMDSQHNYITDLVSYNHYFGWYCGTVANIGAFGPIVAIKTMQPPVPLMDFLPQVGNLPAGGMSYINCQLNLIPKES